MDDLIDRILLETDYGSNPYITSLQDGSFAKDDFVETQIQFFFAVTFFSRPMAAVAAKIPRAAQRIEVLRNVWEEHGEGNEVMTHGDSFLEFLRRLDGVGFDAILEKPLWPEVRAFNTMLAGACVLDEHLVGVGVLGMIERMFADISAWIGRAVVDRGWIAEDRLIHYNLHEVLDHKHSADFFDVVRPAFGLSPESAYYIEQGLRLGAYSFDALYRDLHRARRRRATREVRVPHLRS